MCLLVLFFLFFYCYSSWVVCFCLVCLKNGSWKGLEIISFIPLSLSTYMCLYLSLSNKWQSLPNLKYFIKHIKPTMIMFSSYHCSSSGVGTRFTNSPLFFFFKLLFTSRAGGWVYFLSVYLSFLRSWHIIIISPSKNPSCFNMCCA